MRALPALLMSPKMQLRKEVCWALSNITAGTPAQLDEVMRTGLLELIVARLDKDEFDVQKEAAWVLANARPQGARKSRHGQPASPPARGRGHRRERGHLYCPPLAVGPWLTPKARPSRRRHPREKPRCAPTVHVPHSAAFFSFFGACKATGPT